MVSSLFGFYNAHRALLTNQAAINLINSNISNMNVEGYSKQRLELSQDTIIQKSNNPYLAAQSGVGARIDEISRNRDIFLDTYFRKEDSVLAYYKELNENTLLVEDVANQLSGNGVINAMQEFYTAAHNLSLNPTDSIARTNLVQKGIDVCTKFNHTSTQLTDLRENLVGDGTSATKLASSKVNLTVQDLNNKLKALTDLNHTICISSSQGVTPNGLLDQRDLLLDDISQFIPITTTYGASNQVTIAVNGVELVKGNTQVAHFDTQLGTAANPATVRIIKDSDSSVLVANLKTSLESINPESGQLLAMLQLGGSDPTNLTNINTLLGNLDNLAREFTREVNAIQNQGQYINKTTGQLVQIDADTAPIDFFVDDDGIDVVSTVVGGNYSTGFPTANYTGLTAANIRVNNKTITIDPFKIAAASSDTVTTNPKETGDGKNALLFAQLRDKSLANLNNSTTEDFLSATVGKLGAQSKSIEDNLTSQDTILQQLKLKRETSMGVNLDEELADLVKFQRSYEASAKVFSTVDQMIQQIIGLAR